jgi:hypothetical protein
MALFKLNRNLPSEINTGFGASSSNSGGRFYNREIAKTIPDLSKLNECDRVKIPDPVNIS